MSHEDPRNTPPTAQDSMGGSALSDEDFDWLELGSIAFRASTNYVDSNLRKQWDNSMRAFNNQHPSESKYTQPAYAKRSRLYRPKVRAIIRKNEAAAAAAYFSNLDVVSFEPSDSSDKYQQASASIMKELLQYRLTKSIDWFQTLMGGVQDAQTTAAIAHVYWEYEEAERPEVVAEKPTPAQNAEYPHQSQIPQNAYSVELLPTQEVQPVQAESAPKVKRKVLKDKPCVDLIPVENLRVDPACDWRDPIGTSPYVIQLIPYYVGDLKRKVKKGEWSEVSQTALSAAKTATPDTTRLSRNREAQDPMNVDNQGLTDYDIVWVQRHIHRRDGTDYEFYMLGDFVMLTEAYPLTDTVFHGRRPYVFGRAIIEAHKVYSSSIPTLARGLSDEANEIANQRIDNVKFVLNKRFFAKRGRDVDVAGLVRNVPGGVVMMEDPANDVREINWPDVTSSSYEEQGRIDNDMNDLLGNFSAAQVMADHGINGPARNMQILSQSSGTLVEYMLMTFTHTFVLPILNQLVLLEQYYETDEVLMALVGKKAQLFQKFGINEATDDMLQQELTVKSSVGMGATDPQMKLQKFIAGMNFYTGLVKQVPPGMNLQEIGKEVFAHIGYQDGARFFTVDDPQVLALQQQLQQQSQVIQQLNAKVQEKMTAHQVKLKATEMTNQTALLRTQIHEDNENKRSATTHLRAIVDAEKDRNLTQHLAYADHIQQARMADAQPKKEAT